MHVNVKIILIYYIIIVTTEASNAINNNMPILVSIGVYMQYSGRRNRTPLLHPKSVESSKSISQSQSIRVERKKQGKHTL